MAATNPGTSSFSVMIEKLTSGDYTSTQISSHDTDQGTNALYVALSRDLKQMKVQGKNAVAIIVRKQVAEIPKSVTDGSRAHAGACAILQVDIDDQQTVIDCHPDTLGTPTIAEDILRELRRTPNTTLLLYIDNVSCLSDLQINHIDWLIKTFPTSNKIPVRVRIVHANIHLRPELVNALMYLRSNPPGFKPHWIVRRGVLSKQYDDDPNGK
jgi:hypothetical protein